jgi:hypothetical protein
MKKISITLLLLAMLCVWVACKKSKSSTPDPVIARGMHAKINGVAWAATYISYISAGNYIDVSGYDSATGKTVDLRIGNFKTRGTFNIPQANDSAFYASDYGVLLTPLVATSGTIAIQAVNDTAVGGSFSFTAGSITVTEGTFNSNY